MSRFYLIIALLFSGFSFSQTEMKKYIEFADEQYQKGDYIYALEYYKKAMDIDSSSVDIFWKYAQANRAYKDYRKAEYYYQEVFDREDTKIYKASLLYLGLMQKQNGKYDEAIETFKLAKKKYRKYRKDYVYLKTKRELKSCLWAKNAKSNNIDVIFEQLPNTVNTANAEFGHRVANGKLIYSSLRAEEELSSEEVYDSNYKTKLYSAVMDTSFKEGGVIKDLLAEAVNTGNGSFSIDGKRFYFSNCTEDNYNYHCKIMVADYENGKWTRIDELGEVINTPNANTTMPYIADWNGEEVLFYASDREGGKGKMDIWYSFIINGNQFKKPKNINSINSIENELSPYWNNKENTLYFSSSWWNGFGGNDVFLSKFLEERFQLPENLGKPVNSAANDIYYFKTGDSSYVTSNRLGVIYSKNPTCCSDIFLAYRPLVEEKPSETETLEELNKRLPVTMYFHNDIPDPRSIDTTTKVNYENSYNAYIEMLPRYKKEYAKGLRGEKSEDAKDDIEDFFIEYVEQGMADLNLFRTLLLEELEKGRKIELTVKGFASPLAKTDYNVNLTKRRIKSLENYLKEWGMGEFNKYFDKGFLTIVQVPFGEYTANKLTSDNPNDVKNSIFSRAAGLERKIEVQSVSFIEDELNQITPEKQVQDFGVIKKGEVVEREFVLKNTSNKTVEIEDIKIPCVCNKAELEKFVLQPGEETTLKMSFDSALYTGEIVKSVYLKLKHNKEDLRLIITGVVE